VVRCFEDDNIVHVEGKVDPAADIETIETELILKDLETVQKRLDRARRAAKGQDPIEKKAVTVCENLERILDSGELANTYESADADDKSIVHDMFLLTRKPIFYVTNVSESDAASPGDNELFRAVMAIGDRRKMPVVAICAAIEAEIMQLAPAERPDFLESVGLSEPGLNEVIRTGYRMLDLITYFTAGDPEVHAWTIARGTKAPQAAGKIHTDFERGFIKAEVIHWKDLIDLGSEAAVRSAGKMGIEGKEYVVRDGDVMHFRFNV
jgi:hypothetical protein